QLIRLVERTAGVNGACRRDFGFVGCQVTLRSCRARVREVAVRALVGAILGAQLLAEVAASQPAALNLGHVPDQADEREVRWAGGTLRQLIRGQPRALAPQRLPVELQPGVELGALVGVPGNAIARDLGCGPCHWFIMTCPRPL